MLCSFNDCSISELLAVVSSGVVLELDRCFAVSMTAVFQNYLQQSAGVLELDPCFAISVTAVFQSYI